MYLFLNKVNLSRFMNNQTIFHKILLPTYLAQTVAWVVMEDLPSKDIKLTDPMPNQLLSGLCVFYYILKSQHDAFKARSTFTVPWYRIDGNVKKNLFE